MRHFDPARVSDDTLPRLKAIVENSAPDPNKPMLPPHIEDSLAETDRAQASCYAGLEEVTYRTYKLAEKIAKKG